MPPTDPDRAAVYDAETRLERWLDLGEITVFGSHWVPEPEVRFARVDDVQTYADRVLAHLGHGVGVRVRARRGATAAHYEHAGRVIAVPSPQVGGSWALREAVVLHEIAHHLHATGPGGPAGAQGAHGPQFRAQLVDLHRRLGHEVVARLLAIAYTDAGVPPGPTPG